MTLENATITELSNENEDDFRLTLAGDKVRVDFTMDDEIRQMLIRKLIDIGDKPGGDIIDDDAEDPFACLE